ncbi:MAG: internal scaffolding protein [Microviridae sp.]|nr:MAG: internal scaffolding protein [Microviridae sp.]
MKNPPFVRNPYNYDLKAACEECCVKDFGPSLTQQSQSEDADINVIVKRFGLTGHLPENYRVPEYGDFEGIFDFQTAQQVVIDARDNFMKMPPELRRRFGHDPQIFLEFCSDPENLPEMRRLGLAKEPAEAIASTRSPPTAPASNAVGGASGAGGLAQQSGTIVPPAQ